MIQFCDTNMTQNRQSQSPSDEHISFLRSAHRTTENKKIYEQENNAFMSNDNVRKCECCSFVTNCEGCFREHMQCPPYNPDVPFHRTWAETIYFGKNEKGEEIMLGVEHDIECEFHQELIQKKIFQ
jgi:hypothetical protein